MNGWRLVALTATLPLSGMLIAALLYGWTLSAASWLLSALAMSVLILVVVSSVMLRERLRCIPLTAFGDGEQLQLSASTRAVDIIRLAGTPTEQWDDGEEMTLAYSASFGHLRFYCDLVQDGTGRLRYVELDREAL